MPEAHRHTHSHSLHEAGTGTHIGAEQRESNAPGDKPVNYAEYVSQGDNLNSVASVNSEGRISVQFDLMHGMPELSRERTDSSDDLEEFAIDKRQWKDCPTMSIVIMIVGSRGDVQPYVALGKELKKDGHRVRIATHETFRSFVGDAGLEFYNIGGDPQDLMSYMVKNPGLMPGFESLTNGDIVRKRKMLNEMIHGCWDACHSPCTVTGQSFAADAIISNPPAFAHVHCAEALGIPLLLSFTMPWTATAAFPHPLVNILNSNVVPGVSNYLSYAVADILTWKGVGDIINIFRTNELGLSPLSIRSGPAYTDRLKIPWTYCMSPTLVPKPEDWKTNMDVVGFYFLDLASKYEPPPDLSNWLSNGEPPVYIGFGSVVVDDPAAMSEIIFEATSKAGVRALVSSGWGGLGGVTVPPHIFMLGNVPHDWLFDKGRVSAVVHHGGAGTTAIGLAKGCPTVVVPFFGDQGFWGNMICNSGAGPKPIPHKELSVKKLQEAITYAISPEAKEAARHLAQKIHDEDGVKKGVESFYKHLPLLNMRCDLDPTRLAVWWSTEQCLKLSAFAAQTLADAKLISLRNLILHRPKDFKPRKNPQDGSSGGANGLFWSLTSQSLIGSAIQSTVGKAADEAAHGIMDAMCSMHEGLRTPKQERRSDSSMSTGARSPRPSLIGSLKNLMGASPAKRQLSQSQPKLSLMTIPVQGSWKLVKTKNGQTVYNRERLTRIAEGRKAIKASTEEQRAKVIERFKEEISQTPIRKKMYQDAVDRQYGSSVATTTTGSTLDGSSMPDRPSTDDDGSGRGKKRPSNVHKPSSSISSILSVISPIENISPKKSFFGKKFVEPPVDVDAAAAEAQAQVVTEKSPRSPLWKGSKKGSS